MLQTIQLSHMPPELLLHVALYRDVQNAAYLREQLLAGNHEFEYAFIDASMVITENHVLAAAFRAMNDYVNQRIKSHNVHSEIVFALSPNNNIGEAFRRFGINDKTVDLLVLRVSMSAEITHESVQRHLNSIIKGVSLPLNVENLHAVSDLAKIGKAYKLNANPPLQGNTKQAKNGDTLQRRKEMEKTILGAIALRGAS